MIFQVSQLRKKSLTGVFLFLLGLTSLPAQAGSAPPQLREWSEVMNSERLKVIDELGTKIPDVIFDLVSNIDTGLYSNTHFSLDLSVHRNVYNNREIHRTWTVIDKLGVGWKIPFFTIPSTSPVGSPIPSLGLFIGTEQGVEVMDIRQVRPKNYASLPSPEERKTQVEAETNFKTFALNQQEAPPENTGPTHGRWIQAINEKGDKIMSFLPADGESFARYSRFWNFALIPFRLPLNFGSFSQMEDEEIISYQGRGSIELGLSAGWGIDLLSPAGFAEAGISVSALMRGNYRISVLRENDHVARVKVTRSKGLAAGLSAGGDYKPGLLDFVFIVRNINNLFKVVPVKLSYEQTRDWGVDIAYQYDLSIPSGRAAYEQAVLGLFKQSEDLAIQGDQQWRTELSETGVIRVVNRDTYSSSENLRTKMQLSFLFKKSSSGSVTDVESKVTMADGTRHTFKALAENTQEWSLIWSRYEKSQHNFSVNLDMDEVARNPTRKDAFALTVEGRMDDSNTSPRELLSYILEVENSVGKTDLFPRTVELDKLKGSYYDVPNPFKSSADLGSSHFYYQLMLNPQQVQKFIEYPESKMWTALEKAFHPEDIWPAWLWPDGSWSARWKRYLCNFACFPVTVMDVPLNLFQLNLAPGTDLLYAQWIHNQWVELKKIENIKDRAEALVQMFFDRLYSRTLIYLLRSTLEGENIDYYVNATNGAIGKVVKEGGSKLVYDDVATRANEAIEFDRHGSRLPGPNPMLKIENFSADPSGSDVKLTFELAETPKKLYFDVSYDDGRLSPFRNNGLTALVVENKGNFFKGLNIIILDPKDFDDPMLDISRTLEKKGKYTLRMAASQDGLTWGETVERTFRVF